MLGLQGLDVVIGLALTMAIVSLAASTMLEGFSSAIGKRGKALKSALDGLVQDITRTEAVGMLLKERVFGGEKRFPSYISKDTFADAVGELIEIDQEMTADLPNAEYEEHFEAHVKHPLMARVLRTAKTSGGDPTAIRATIDRLFDEAMDRLSGAYKRWTMAILFVIGLSIAVIGNVSIFHTAKSLWEDGAARDAVVEAAQNIGAGDEALDGEDLESVAETVEHLDGVGVPVGWTDEAQADWGESGWWPSWTRLAMMAGWLATAALTTLGAPFWFDLLSRLIAIRGAGKPKDAATADTAAAATPTAALAAAASPPSTAEAAVAVRAALGV
jgi:hypothetical protein